jgi:hypothetical protein
MHLKLLGLLLLLLLDNIKVFLLSFYLNMMLVSYNITLHEFI